MKIMTLGYVLLFNMLSLTLTAQNSTHFKWPSNEIAPIFEEFVKAYNANDLKIMEAFTSKYAESNAEDMAAYWRSLFLEYREIAPFSIAKDFSDKNNLGVFFRGKQTKSWVMIMLRMNADNTKIIGKTVGRGMLPSGDLSSAYNRVSPNEIAPYLEKYLEGLNEIDYFSGSVLVAKGDTIVFERSYGKSNKERNIENNINTSFNIASTTKTFTSIAIAQLEEQGKLNYADPISKFIPEYPEDIARQVTIHHLLTHTSGIELDDYEPFNADNDRAKNMNDYLSAQVLHIDSLNEGRRQNFKPLNKFDYSNENYALLGLIIERVSNMSYAEYIEKYIFAPLHMKHSFADINKVNANENTALGYSFHDDKGQFIDGSRHQARKEEQFLSPFGGIYSTPKDLYTYLRAINSHTLVNKETQVLLYQKHAKRYDVPAQSAHYGYGFFIIRKGQTVAVGHGGTYFGVGSHCYYYPDSDHYIIVLSNHGAIVSSTVADHIASVIP